MATLVLGTIGRAIGGPIGGIVGTLVGGAVDRAVFGTGPPKQGARLADLSVQSAAYGQPLPRIYGRMRVAGNLIWTAGIVEAQQRSGSAKSGTATTIYTYSASFAVVVSGRPIVGIGRIWADGKLLRASDGTLNFPATFRTYSGFEAQVADPLIVAAEGMGAAPAYRGRGMIVFENMPLADYGNRIPNLTFEVIADEHAVSIGTVANDLTGGVVAGGDDLPFLLGYAAAQAGTVRQALTTLGSVTDLALHDDGSGLSIGSGAAVITVAETDTGATDAAKYVVELDETRADETAVADAVWLSYSDVDRDYQTSIQAATRRTPALRIDQHDLTAAAAAADVKALAARALREAIAARTTAKLALPWRYAALRPGDALITGGEAATWRVTQRTITGAVVSLDLDRVSVPAVPAFAGDSGRAYVGDDSPQGTTELQVLDVAALPGAVAAQPQLLLAAAGASGWRRADVLVSRDGGNSYDLATSINAAATLGTTVGALPAGTTTRWDRSSTVDVDLLSDDDALQSASEAAVLAGANLAAIGDELIQFANAAPLGPRRFRLSTLLRGRRGSEALVANHVSGERFVLLDSRVVALNLPAETLGSTLSFKAVGPADDPAGVAALALIVRGVSLQPLSPAAVTVNEGPGGDRVVSWIRRSRSGYAWIDGTDAPVGEEAEAYRVTVAAGGTIVRTADVAQPSWTYAAGDFVHDSACNPGLTLAVAQVSAVVGAGMPTIVPLQ